MPMLPDPAHTDIIDKACISAFEAEEPVSVFSLCENIMDDPKLPMHCPYHHYLIPAVLLTAAGKISGETEEMLQKRLKTARGARRNGAGGLLRTVRLLRRRCGRGNFCLRLAGLNAALQNRLGGRE